MSLVIRGAAALRHSSLLAAQALRAWTARQIAAAIAGTLVVGALIGAATVLLPNPVFGREIPPVTWNYPVWAVASILSGMLLATYVRPAAPTGAAPATAGGAVPGPSRRPGRLGMAGTLLAWFAVGCPVCNKLALLALGYTGALTWYAPVQPYLGGAAILLSSIALVARLKGQQVCPVPTAPQGVLT